LSTAGVLAGECQHDLLVGEKIELLEMLEAEAGAARGVDLDHARKAKRVGIGTRRFRLRQECSRRSNRAGDLDLVAGRGGFGRRRRFERGGLCGGDALRGSGRALHPEPDAGDRECGHETCQHQTQRVAHGYSFLKIGKIFVSSFMENSR
jgi:hypothetical protein